jgi:glycosyltransferase involved in cell wall biosynthesis
MRILVWQWGRRGGGPRFAAELAASLGTLPGVQAVLSLSAQAEILAGPAPPPCALPVTTYRGFRGFALRLLASPFLMRPLAADIAALRPDIAICAMPGPLDLLAARALRRLGIKFLVVVHDADAHPGDGMPLQMTLQRWLVRRADGLVALSAHVANRLREQGLVGHRPLIMATHLPLVFGPPPPPPRSHGGRLRLLFFGRLLPYKGLDLLAEALLVLGPRGDMEMRVVGSGPDSEVLAKLRKLPGVRVENRWVAESEVGEILAWADALVLPYREASQSGVAAAAIAARRWVVATNVGGIAEQLGGEKLARLCEPNAASLANALRGLLESPPPPSTSPEDPRAAWRGIAADLVREMSVMLATEKTDLNPRIA